MERSFIFYTTEGHGWLSSLTGNLAPLVLGLEQAGYILLKVTPLRPGQKVPPFRIHPCLSARVKRLRIRSPHIRFINFHSPQYIFAKEEKQTLLSNLDKQPLDAFRVFRNGLSECTIQQIRPLPFFHLT